MRVLRGSADGAILVSIFFVAVALAVLVQRLLFGSELDSEAWLQLLVLSLGFHALLETVLKYALLPDVRLITPDRVGESLGPEQEIDEGGLEGYDLFVAKHGNYLRQFAILRFEVEHRQPPRPLRALGPRLAVQGASVRFRYRPYPERSAWTDWRYGRWDAVPQPLTGNKLDLRALETNHSLPSLFPKAERERLAFAIKRVGADEFYHFNDASYRFPAWRNPEWVLRSGVYEVEAELAGHGLSWSRKCTFWVESAQEVFRALKGPPPIPTSAIRRPVEHLPPSLIRRYQDGGQFRDLLNRLLRLQEENLLLRRQLERRSECPTDDTGKE